MHALDTLNLPDSRGGYSQSPSPALIQYTVNFDRGKVVRVLFKIAYNVIAASARETNVCRETFRTAVEIVFGKTPIELLLQQNGFIHTSDPDPMRISGKHTFRLPYSDRLKYWRVHLCFFGLIAAIVKVPGISSEWWRQVDLVCPLDSKEWEESPSRIVTPNESHVTWFDIIAVMPPHRLNVVDKNY